MYTVYTLFESCRQVLKQNYDQQPEYTRNNIACYKLHKNSSVLQNHGASRHSLFEVFHKVLKKKEDTNIMMFTLIKCGNIYLGTSMFVDTGLFFASDVMSASFR